MDRSGIQEEGVVKLPGEGKGSMSDTEDAFMPDNQPCEFRSRGLGGVRQRDPPRFGQKSLVYPHL